MSKAPPSLQFYPGDRLKELMPIIADSEAVGAWTKLWIYLWDNGPAKSEVLQQVAGKGWDRVGFLLSDFDGLLSMSWIEEKRSETMAFKARQAENGRKGGRPIRKPSKGKNPSLSSGKPKRNPKESPRVEGEGEREGESEGEERRGSGGTDSAIIPMGVTLPPNLDTAEFRSAWSDWETHRREIKKKLTPTQSAAQIAQCAAWGHEVAIRTIRHTITMGWQGLRQPDPSKLSPTDLRKATEPDPNAEVTLGQRYRNQRS